MSVELALAGVSVIQGAAGSENWSADEATYPSNLEHVDPHRHILHEVPFAWFEYDVNQAVGEDATRMFIAFNLSGYFSFGSDEATVDNRVMANCHVQCVEWEAPLRWFDHFSLTADALDTAIGPPDDPKIQWHVYGRFDPVSFGDVSFDVLMNLDQFGRLTLAREPRVDNNGWLSTAEFVSTDSGFHVRLRQS